jgi:hypothetical protein
MMILELSWSGPDLLDLVDGLTVVSERAMESIARYSC